MKGKTKKRKFEDKIPDKKESISGHAIEKPADPSNILDRLSFHRLLGEGCYGKVMLASDSITKQLYAVKIIKKHALLGNEDDSTFVERRVLEVAKGCPFLTDVYATMQTKDHLLFVMQYLPGGDLDQFMGKNGKLDINTARFFAAELVCGLQYLHKNGIIHRDIKPDNVLLDSQGHIKIADFGLALENVYRNQTAKGYAGTLGYVAPEMLRDQRYNAAVDWWSMGVMVYKMVTGEDPFYCGNSSDHMIRSALRDTPKYPSDLTPDTVDLLKKLLCKNPSKRLGKRGNIRNHPFFKSIDWNELEAGRVNPPFSLCTTSSPQTEDVLRKSEVLCAGDESERISPKDQRRFIGFSYISPKWMDMEQSTAGPSVQVSNKEERSGTSSATLQDKIEFMEIFSCHSETASCSSSRKGVKRRRSDRESGETPDIKKRKS
uniref:Uncharacterized protein n=1 Tax=Leptobrachium leishanense TaxID=445787 RepID=A0A8C5QGB6_9ANUR